MTKAAGQRHPVSGQRTKVLGISLAILLLIAIAVGLNLTFGPPNLQDLRRQTERQFRLGDYQRAQQSAASFLSYQPEADDIRLIAAQSAMVNQDLQAAAAFLRQVKGDSADHQLSAALLTAQLMHESLFDLSAAEAAYRQALELQPENAQALDGLVRLMAVSGRRRELLPHLIRLVQLGHSSYLLLISARASGAISDLPLLQQAHQAFPREPRALMGLALQASQAGDFDEAAELCRQAFASPDAPITAAAALGQYLLEAQQYDQLDAWYRSLPQSANQVAETWQVLGQYFERQGRRQLALQSFLQAARLGPDLKVTHHRLSLLLRAAGDEQAAAVFEQHLNQLQQLEQQQDRLFSVGPNDAAELSKTIGAFESIGRIWEAFGWTQLGFATHPDNTELAARLEQLTAATQTLPVQLFASDYIPAMRFDSDDYALSDQQPSSDIAAQQRQNDGSLPFVAPCFRNDAGIAGLQFRFHNGVPSDTSRRMFEFTGGGIGILDIDLDDAPDVYFSQGGLWETRGTADDACDVMFRNRPGAAFADVSQVAGIHDRFFGQGVAAGDVNQDGFPDLFVANIGPDILYLNQGDGTFVPHVTASAADLTNSPIGLDGTELNSELNPAKSSAASSLDLPATTAPNDIWTTSCLIADLDGNGAPDILTTNYLQGSDLFERICQDANGRDKACIPVHFDAVSDEILQSHADGTFHRTSLQSQGIAPGKGLGLLAWSPGNNGQLAAFVANDTTPNMLLTFTQQDDRLTISDNAVLHGVALSGEGKAEGSMGIAASDINDDGFLDLLVTNFFNESNTLYQSSPVGTFDDQTQARNLVATSLPVLGFGTHFLDVNLDGFPELFVANGHVDDLRSSGRPYHMPAHLFRLQQGQFELLPAELAGDYFQQQHLGRAAAVIDWNRDLRPDLIVGHLQEDYALLTNTMTNAGNAVSLRLIGVTSPRDPVGATIRYQLQQRQIVRQLTAGDGYQCSNDHTLLLSCGTSAQIDNVQITWQGGQTQQIKSLTSGQRYVVIEDRQDCLRLPDADSKIR